MSSLTRRQFVTGTLATGAAMAGPLPVGANPLGANDDLRVAVIGFRGQGRGHIQRMRAIEGVRLVALCDVDPAVLHSQADVVGGKQEHLYTDVRKLLERTDIDAITTATPNHWHALISIWAVQAGKDVYVEKPVSHNVWEGRQLVTAARKHEKIVQTGTQSRSGKAVQAAIEYAHSGALGSVQLVKGLCYKGRMSIGKVGKGEIPGGLDYNLWCGPAPHTPLRRKNLHYDWHWVHATGNGDLGNQGIHEMDMARWAAKADHLSPRVLSIGGRFGYEDDGETPNTQIIFHDYPEIPLIFEVRGLPKGREFREKSLWGRNMDSPPGFGGQRGVGVEIHCQEGKVVISNGNSAVAFDSRGETIKTFDGSHDHKMDHMRNFVTAVRSRRTSDLTADILEGHLSSALCHTGMISHLLGAVASPSSIQEQIQGDRNASASFASFQDHLANNDVSIDTDSATLGPWLEMDPTTERFTNSQHANQLLTRNYRKPFAVPQVV